MIGELRDDHPTRTIGMLAERTELILDGLVARADAGVNGDEGAQAMVPLLPAFAPFGIRRFRPRAFGADVAPIVREGALAFSLLPDGRHYFDLHHTAADTLDKIRPEDLRRNAAAIALLGFVLAER